MKLQRAKTSQVTGVIKYQYFLTIPKTLIDSMGWKKGDEIIPTVHGKDMILLKKTKVTQDG